MCILMLSTIYTRAVDPVTVSIEKSFYSITQPEDSVEICINATKTSLDQSITINLQTQCALL